jgi:teichuronic acid biosynthesis glycosyltransferase TuaG
MTVNNRNSKIENLNDKEEIVFSIIVPCFNAENTIHRTLLSIKKQTYEYFEVIIINDGSTDLSHEIINKFLAIDHRFVCLKNIKNKGLALTRNAGLKFAKGKYICFLDADDWWPSNKLEIFSKYFNQGYDVLFSNYVKVYPSGKKKVIKVLRHLNYKSFFYRNPIPLSSSAYKVSSFGKVRFDNITYSEDWIFWISLFKRKINSFGIDKSLMFYHVSPHSLSSNKIKMFFRAWYIFRTKFQFNFFFSLLMLFRYSLSGLLRRIF